MPRPTFCTALLNAVIRSSSSARIPARPLTSTSTSIYCWVTHAYLHPRRPPYLGTFMPPKRSLFLHLSALSDAEYVEYVRTLHDVFDELDKPSGAISDDDLENKRVGLPVVRAWMKGRFRDLGSPEIDKVLHLFAPHMPENEMSGGQLLAALRLLMHARCGGEINEGSVFIQAEPVSPTVSRHTTFSISAKYAVELEHPTTDDAPSSPKSGPARLNPFFGNHSVYRQDDTGLAPPNQAAPDSPRRASLTSAPSAHPTGSSISVPPGTTNPFLQRAKTHSGTYEPKSVTGRTPPLPPRKPSHMSSSSIPTRPPPLPAKPSHSILPHPSTSGTSISGSSSSAKGQSPPPVPPHRVTPLMQQSLLASRVGASLKRSEEEARRTRVLEVIRSSSDASVLQNISKERGRTQSSSRSPEKDTRRPVPQPPRVTQGPIAKSDSYAPSVASLEEIAGAQLSRLNLQSRPGSSSRSSSPSDQEHRSAWQSTADQFSPPPTHPARRPSTHSSGRSRHIRSPSFQAYNPQHASAGGAPSINKTVSTSGFYDQFRQSTSASPSPSPVHLAHSRPSRSQSLRQPPSPSTLDQPSETGDSLLLQRRRPESAQFASRPRLLDPDQSIDADNDETSSPFANTFEIRRRGREGTSSVVGSIAPRFEHRNPDLERNQDKDSDREPNAFASLQRTFSALQQRAQPAITRARFKAEAGFLAPRRGFLPNGRDYHLAGEGGDRLVSQNNTGDEGGMDLTPTTDQDYEEDASESRENGCTHDEGAKEYFMQRDNLKLPEGEGWKRL